MVPAMLVHPPAEADADQRPETTRPPHSFPPGRSEDLAVTRLVPEKAQRAKIRPQRDRDTTLKGTP
jgi:hypothetical protein